MGLMEEHHDLSLKILVGRSLPKLPWSISEDQEMVARERVLWAALTEDERAQEQAALMALWGSRKADRTVLVPPTWGKWAEGLGAVKIPNAAFGTPSNDFRPYSKGKPLDGDTNAAWLYDHGYQVMGAKNGVYTLMLTSARAVPEIERLFSLLARKNPNRVHPWGDPRGGIQLRLCMDPCLGVYVGEVTFTA